MKMIRRITQPAMARNEQRGKARRVFLVSLLAAGLLVTETAPADTQLEPMRFAKTGSDRETLELISTLGSPPDSPCEVVVEFEFVGHDGQLLGFETAVLNAFQPTSAIDRDFNPRKNNVRELVLVEAYGNATNCSEADRVLFAAGTHDTETGQTVQPATSISVSKSPGEFSLRQPLGTPIRVSVSVVDSTAAAMSLASGGKVAVAEDYGGDSGHSGYPVVDSGTDESNGTEFVERLPISITGVEDPN